MTDDNKSIWCKIGSHCWHTVRIEKVKVRQTEHDGFNKTYNTDKVHEECCHCHKKRERFLWLWYGKSLEENGLEVVKK